MCLAVPGRIESITGDEPLTRSAKVNFAGVVKEVNIAFVPQAVVGDYVLVHAGTALSRIDADEAEKVFEYLRLIASSESAPET
jgi:hydrogenase expression/formation protein HypC